MISEYLTRFIEIMSKLYFAEKFSIRELTNSDSFISISRNREKKVRENRR